jgi:exopolyphosphatase / guanosine-5'-triphosphate,3'-diphosphate pyrophosphatase
MRVAVVDIGTNSTRLLVADARADGVLDELVRRSEVTRLGEGVDAHGYLGERAIERTEAVLAVYRETIDEHRCDANLALLTSAVRDASNGPEFVAHVRERFGLHARTLSGDEEAQLTFLGAMSSRHEHLEEPTVVIDIGGGSTELVVGSGHEARFHVSLQTGVVRMSERHIHSDPPEPAELEQLTADTRSVLERGVPSEQRAHVTQGIAVAGTATSSAAIAQELEPYDPKRVDGYRLSRATVEGLRARLAAMSEGERRGVRGLHPDRAPTIVAGTILLIEAMRAFGLEEVEVSEHDILHGGALSLAGAS